MKKEVEAMSHTVSPLESAELRILPPRWGGPGARDGENFRRIRVPGGRPQADMRSAFLFTVPNNNKQRTGDDG